MRGKRNLTQTELAARAGMSASKISAIESSPKNIELATLIRIATALEYQFRPAFVPAKTNRPAYAATARPRHGRTKKPSNARSMSASALRLRMKPVASSRQ
jgi:transcriptional regulator with XRE-family HTH domain